MSYTVPALNQKENWAVAYPRKQSTMTTVTNAKDYAVNQTKAPS